jgi:RNA polymerase sigma factor (sigma-70 family)
MTTSNLSEVDQDRLLLEIYDLLPRFVMLKVREEDVDDVVQDIATDCLVKLRTGVWTEWPENIHGLAWTLVKNHVIDRRRRSSARDEYDAEHLHDRAARHPAWASPVHASDDQAIHEFQERLLDDFSARARTVFCMVRDEGASYREVAEALHISRETVHNDIRAVRQAFRAALLLQGIDIPFRRAGGRLGAAWRKGCEERLKPTYPAPATETANA